MSSYFRARDALQGERPRAALVIAHPGHELRVHGWLEAARPSVCVLTDGSGRTGRPRLDSTTKVLDAAGARRGAVYGPFSDGRLYAALLEHEHSPFIRLVEGLASTFVRERVRVVAGDAEEGYNPSHGERKVFRERKARWNPVERARGWHRHYDSVRAGRRFVREGSGQLLFDEEDFNRTFLVERLSGVGVVR